ncbi:hypothetical protein CSC14_3941 [Proteus mirabilis]|nr:hypothetical protein CSC14_3941 [Proteus mirabilis]
MYSINLKIIFIIEKYKKTPLYVLKINNFSLIYSESIENHS